MSQQCLVFSLHHIASVSGWRCFAGPLLERQHQQIAERFVWNVEDNTLIPRTHLRRASFRPDKRSRVAWVVSESEPRTCGSSFAQSEDEVHFAQMFSFRGETAFQVSKKTWDYHRAQPAGSLLCSLPGPFLTINGGTVTTQWTHTSQTAFPLFSTLDVKLEQWQTTRMPLCCLRRVSFAASFWGKNVCPPGWTQEHFVFEYLQHVHAHMSSVPQCTGCECLTELSMQKEETLSWEYMHRKDRRICTKCPDEPKDHWSLEWACSFKKDWDIVRQKWSCLLCKYHPELFKEYCNQFRFKGVHRRSVLPCSVVPSWIDRFDARNNTEERRSETRQKRYETHLLLRITLSTVSFIPFHWVSSLRSSVLFRAGKRSLTKYR